jgi:hypothetical protein
MENYPKEEKNELPKYIPSFEELAVLSKTNLEIFFKELMEIKDDFLKNTEKIKIGITWTNPTPEMVKHREIVAIYSYEAYDDKEVIYTKDIFTFEGINNNWMSKTGGHDLKYKDIIAYIPLPEMPEVNDER